MPRYSWGLLVLGCWAAVLLAICDTPVGAQFKKEAAAVAAQDKVAAPRDVEFVSVDHVTLKGKFFASSKGKDAPCVMMLHALGETERSNGPEWTSLARTLQRKGYAVLTFDFRGHGASTTVQPGEYNPNPQLAKKGFWDQELNFKNVKGLVPKKPRPTEINFKDFGQMYYTVLVNDIAAARAFLDERNDAGECNSGNMIVIGAKDGAALGALWLNSEWQRYRFVPEGLGGYLDKDNPEGKCLTAAVWLSIAGKFGKSPQVFNVSKLLEIPAKREKVPMLFLYGDGDEPGKTRAVACEKYIRGTNTKDYQFTAAMNVKGAEGATGRELLLDSLTTTKQILDFLEGAEPAKKAPYKMRAKEASDNTYKWVWTDNSGRVMVVDARQKGMPLVVYAGYASFLK